jgi:hypothetical protein
MYMYPSAPMLAHSRVPHIFSHTYPSDMTCSPPPGKVRHRTFGKLRLPYFLFPPYSSTAVLYGCRDTLVLVRSSTRVYMVSMRVCTLESVRLIYLQYSCTVGTRVLQLCTTRVTQMLNLEFEWCHRWKRFS